MEDNIKEEADFTLAKQYKGRDLNPDIDVQSYINKIDAESAVYPYVCPKCGRPYKDEVMLEVHLDSFDHNNPPDDYDPCDLHWKPKKRVERLKEEFERESRDSGSDTNGPSTPKNTRTPGTRGFGSHKRKRNTWSRKRKANFRRGSDVSDTPRTKTRVRVDEHGRITTENLTWSEAQRLVEFEDDNTNKIYRVSIYEDVEVVKSDGSELPALHKGARVPVPDTVVTEMEVPKLQIRKISSEYIDYKAQPTENTIEYEMDEEDHVMLEHINDVRESDGLKPLSCETLEKFIDAIEKESMWDTGNKPRTSTRDIEDEDVVCCVCNDGECTNTNAILFCDLCNLAVHQECYGVPYIPEGQWLCRRCQFSPSRPVDCVLCPSLNGAFKQTHDNRWCHVVCALWVPEVSFQNPVFLEPIDGFSKVPKARWNLKCYICKKAGACIQCNKNACYTAFHVTCAQQAGLYMEMKVQKSDGINGITSNKVTQTAFCHNHTPKDWSPRPLKSSEKLPKAANRADQFQAKVDETREAVEGRNSSRSVNIPYIPSDKLGVLRAILSDNVTSKVSPLFKQLLTFWNEKRMVRNGVPLIRRLLSVQKAEKDNHATEDDKKKIKEQLRVWQRLRHDLERARLLVEQIKKRERLKAHEIQKQIQLMRLRINPWSYFLRDIIDKLKELDESQIFYHPVTDAIAPLYSKIITSPMAFATMERKVTNSEYKCFAAFEYDVNLILRNCMHYNGNSTIFYKLAKDMETKAQPMLRDARKLAKKYNTVTGQHLQPGDKFDQKEAEVEHIRGVLGDLRKCLRKAQKSPSSKHQKKTVQKLTADIKIFERRLRTMGVEEFETSSPKKAKLEENKNEEEDDEFKNEPDTETEEPQEETVEDGQAVDDETKDEVESTDDDVKEEPDESPPVENGETTPLTEVHENGQELKDPEEPTLKKELANGTVKEPAENELSQFIEEDSNDSQEEIKSSNKKIDLRNFQPLDTVWAKCKGYPWYPARIINPELTTGEPLLLGDEEIPQPSVDIIKAGNRLNLEGDSQHHLVLFFDQKRTWMWLPSNKIALLGKDNKFDNTKLREGKTNAQKKSISRAFKCALEPLSPD